MNPFKQLISDDTGAPSTGRVMSLTVVVPVMIVWTVLCIKKGEFIAPPPAIVALVGAAFAGKSAQSMAENFTGIHFSIPQPQTKAGETPAIPGQNQ